MKQDEIKKAIVRITEANASTNSEKPPESKSDKINKFKKPLIFGLMGFVFFGCMYLIFKPSEKSSDIENIGFNNMVPQPTDADLPGDKAKAYEKEMLEQKNEQKRNALSKLSDYWNSEEKTQIEFPTPDENWKDEQNENQQNINSENPSLNSYRNVQKSLGSFYNNNDSDAANLREQVRALKEQLTEKEVPAITTVDEQLKLMEKSYEMAAKYLPSSNPTNLDEILKNQNAEEPADEKYFTAFESEKNNVVSFLPRIDQASSNLDYLPNRFYGSGKSQTGRQIKNSIKACIHETQKISGESSVRLRLLEAVKIEGLIMPKGTVLTSIGKFQQGRLELKIASIEWEGSIIEVDIHVYDLDGQKGLHVPFSPEINALAEMAGNMSQNSVTNLMLTNSAEQQIAADLSRGVMQGISGYFSKKVRNQKVTLKGGYQLYLVSEN